MSLLNNIIYLWNFLNNFKYGAKSSYAVTLYVERIYLVFHISAKNTGSMYFAWF